MHFFDSHCHFDFAEFNADRATLWQTCRALGITRLLMPGVTPDQWQIAAQLCARYEGLCYAVGLHPHWIEQQQWLQKNTAGLLDEPTREKSIALLCDAITQSRDDDQYHGENKTYCVAVGECGLDKLIGTPMDLQKQLLAIHLSVANQFHLPLTLHCVRAHNELIALLKKNKPEVGGVIHGFSGSYEVACEYVALGFYLGVGGTITYERAQKTRAAVAKIPLENLVLETDAPDMPLQGKQGQRNSPEYIPLVAQVLADLRSTSIDEIAAVTSSNALRLFHRS